MKKELFAAVVRQLGYEDYSEEARDALRDVARGGADAGFGGFTYYSDTCAFTAANRRDIAQLVEETAGEFNRGGVVSFVKGFRCLAVDVSEADIARALYGAGSGEESEDNGVMLAENALAWFTLEEAARLEDDGNAPYCEGEEL